MVSNHMDATKLGASSRSQHAASYRLYITDALKTEVWHSENVHLTCPRIYRNNCTE